MCLEAFTETNFKKILSGWQPRQMALIYVEKDSVSEASFELNYFTRLTAREHFIERQ